MTWRVFVSLKSEFFSLFNNPSSFFDKTFMRSDELANYGIDEGFWG